MTALLREMAGRFTSPVERRLFAEYGAFFVTTAAPPPTIIFADAAEVEAFQAQLAVSRARLGDYEVALQAEAMDALIRAASEMNDREGQITARAADSGGRSYQDTVNLWNRNVTRGLDHWQSEGRLAPERVEQIRRLAPKDQVAVVLDIEDNERVYFGTFFDRSILYSVAAPGASQHLSLLAFDVAEYQDAEVEEALGRFGWFRTVPNDLPHFTYLGHSADSLINLGLTHVERSYGDQQYGFWVPDLERLR
ncbi:MAG: hypothetical protein ACJ74J_05950 [Blastocatellia bacterium]